MENKIKYTIVRATVEDRERVSQFMRTHFYTHEPIHVSLGIPYGHTCIGEILPLPILRQGLSLLAVTVREGRECVVGVCLCRPATPSDVMASPGDETCDKYKLQHAIIKSYVKNAGAKMWKHTGLPRSLQIQHIGVDRSLIRNGIANALLEQAGKMAAEERYPMMHIECSSNHSAKLVEKLGWECVYSLRYDEIVDEDGIQRVCPQKPHEAVDCFVLVL